MNGTISVVRESFSIMKTASDFLTHRLANFVTVMATFAFLILYKKMYCLEYFKIIFEALYSVN